MGYHERLIELRKKNNYTQEELAGIIGVSRQAISKWESGMANPDIEKLIKLSELYGCSIDYIVGNDNKIDENRTNDELNKNIDEANNSENNNDNIDKRKKKINIIIIHVVASNIDKLKHFLNILLINSASTPNPPPKKNALIAFTNLFSFGVYFFTIFLYSSLFIEKASIFIMKAFVLNYAQSFTKVRIFSIPFFSYLDTLT